MDFQGFIRNFANYTPSQIRKMCSDLGIALGDDTMQFCMTYYRDVEKRDPYVDELRLFAGLSNTLEMQADAVCPTDIEANDNYVADTWADLLRKRKLTNPGASYPTTIAEASKIASTYLFRSGKEYAVRSAALCPTDLSTLPATACTSCVTTSSASFGMRVLPFHTEPSQKGDLFLLLSKPNEQAANDFYRAANTFLEEDAIRMSIKGIYSVRKAGLLATLLEICNSAWIDLRVFSPMETAMPMTVLQDLFGGDVLLRISPANLKILLQLADERNLKLFPFASITDDFRFTFSRTRETSFSVQTQFLRTLFHYRSVTATLADEGIAPKLHIEHRAVTAQNNAYLKRSISSPNDAALMHGVLCAASSSAPQASYFKHALYTTLASAMTLAANGIPVEKQNLSVAYSFPLLDDPYTIGKILSTILGVYRAQTELSLPAHAVPIRQSETLTSPALSVFSVAEATSTLPATFTAPGKRIYCIAVQLKENGLPDFEDMRRLMARLVEHAKNNEISAFHVLCGESPTDGILSMSNNVTARLTATNIVTEGQLPLAILLESDAKLPATEIGITVSRAESINDCTTLTSVSDHSLIWSDRVEVLLLCKEKDNNAGALAQLLEARGCRVRCFSNNENDFRPLSRHLLSSHCLITCKDAFLPNEKSVAFALETMQRAGGICISLNEKNVRENHFWHLPNGLDEAILEKICQIMNKSEKKL